MSTEDRPPVSPSATSATSATSGQSSPQAPGPGQGTKLAKDSNLILDELTDRLDSLKLLREEDPARADALLPGCCS